MSTNEDLKIGFQDNSATIADVSESSSVAMVAVGQPQLKKIEVPKKGGLTLHVAIVAYLNSSIFRSLSHNTRYSIVLVIEKFFRFLKSFDCDEQVPLDCLNEFIQYFKNNSQITGGTVYDQLNRLKNCLKWSFDSNSPLSDYAKFLCRQYFIHVSTVQVPVKTPTPPLSKLFSDCPYNDTQILNALIKLSIWILNYEAHLRGKILKVDGIRNLIENIGSRDIYKRPISYASLDREDEFSDEARVLYGTIITEIRNGKNLVLKERLVSDIRHPFEQSVLTEEQLNYVLDRSLMKTMEDKSPKSARGYQITQNGRKKLYVVGAFKCLSIRSLLVPSDIECFAMQCLLAAEKMNSSSIDDLSLDDVVETPQGIQFQFQKNRRPKKNQVNITALHTMGSSIGKTYRLYVESIKTASYYFNSSEKVKLLNYLVKTTGDAVIGENRFGSASNKYVDFLLNKKSHLRFELLKVFKGNIEEFEPIFWLLSKLVTQNKKVLIQQAEYNKTRKVNKSIKRCEIVKESSIGLTIEVIRQSAIVSEDVRLINSPHLFNKLKITSQSANHSPTVHNEVYIDRSTAKEKVESDRLFVSRIGALMEQDAKLVGSLLEKTSVLDYNQALEVLGLPRMDEGAHERISKKIAELGIDVDLMDSFEISGKKFFLSNKTTIALIIKYLEHIRANFEEVLNDDSSQLTKATLAARDYFYFSAILQKFPESARKEGERYAEFLPFSYAKLGDIAGEATNDRK